MDGMIFAGECKMDVDQLAGCGHGCAAGDLGASVLEIGIVLGADDMRDGEGDAVHI